VTNDIDIVFFLGNCLPPRRATLKLDVVEIDASVDDVDVDTYARTVIVDVLLEVCPGQTTVVADARQSLRNKWDKRDTSMSLQSDLRRENNLLTHVASLWVSCFVVCTI
jgi:hypothetical protein